MAALNGGNSATLVIPTAFVSWTGEALDKKTPLLRSMEAVSKQAVRVLKLFGSTAERVFATCGPEQEYFLIDRNFYFARPDLINAGRTLFGAKPPKGQELEDQYFGAIPARVLACMAEAEIRAVQGRRAGQDAAQRSGAEPVRDRAGLRERQPRHRPPDDDDGDAEADRAEVRPGVPAAREAVRRRQRLGQAQQLVAVRRVRQQPARPRRHAARQHAVPGLLRGGDPRRGRWQGLLRASIASAGNDHRLGANEAPPAIISVFLGDHAHRHLRAAREGRGEATKQGGMLDLGVSVLPKLPRDAGDRNRTSPFAFTGNKFEFRAVSSGQNIALPNMVLNAAWPIRSTRSPPSSRRRPPRARTSKGASASSSRRSSRSTSGSSSTATTTRPSGTKEAGKRGLLNLKNTVDALPQLVTKDAIKLFERFKILNEREMHARYEIFLENYNKTINIEGQLMVLMANRYILPAAFEYQKQVGQSVAAVKAGGGKSVQGKKLLAALHEARRQVQDADRRAGASRSITAAARPRSTRSTCATRSCRRWPSCARSGDEIEVLTPHELWPLPTYREMLFVK